MTGVIIDSDVFFCRIRIKALPVTPDEESLEKSEGFFGVFKVAEGLGFEAQVEVFTGFFNELLNGDRAGVEISEDEIFIGFEFLEGAGKS